MIRKASFPPVTDARTRVLICGSLYLAGEVLKSDGWPYEQRKTQ